MSNATSDAPKHTKTTPKTNHQNGPQSPLEGQGEVFDDGNDRFSVSRLERDQNGLFTGGGNLPGGDRPNTQLREARAIQRLIFSRCVDIQIKPVDLAALARAWCALQESIRVLRGIPLPGQFRPEISEKRVKGFIDVAKSGGSFSEAVEATSGPDNPQPKPKRAPFGRKPKPTTPTPTPDAGQSSPPVAESQTTPHETPNETGNGA